MQVQTYYEGYPVATKRTGNYKAPEPAPIVDRPVGPRRLHLIMPPYTFEIREVLRDRRRRFATWRLEHEWLLIGVFDTYEEAIAFVPETD